MDLTVDKNLLELEHHAIHNHSFWQPTNNPQIVAQCRLLLLVATTMRNYEIVCHPFLQ